MKYSHIFASSLTALSLMVLPVASFAAPAVPPAPPKTEAVKIKTAAAPHHTPKHKKVKHAYHKKHVKKSTNTSKVSLQAKIKMMQK